MSNRSTQTENTPETTGADGRAAGTGRNDVLVIREGGSSSAPAVTAIIAVLVIVLAVLGALVFTDVFETAADTATGEDGGIRIEVPEEFAPGSGDTSSDTDSTTDGDDATEG